MYYPYVTFYFTFFELMTNCLFRLALYYHK